ncbi:4Fe-4S binding protein [Serratia aquatilis]|uniref:4Fe-4S binding protein n=1 Tax=Serratia aquatilis TaxID=1737515 RepID=UPI00384D124B
MTLNDGKVNFDTENCISCGACLFACPTGGVDKIVPPLRHYRDNTLVMPLSNMAPSVGELLMWHAEYHIRAVEFELALNPGWGMAIATLNIRLKQLKQPLWRIVPPPATAVDKTRRHWLQIDNNSKTGRATQGGRMRRALFQAVSEYQILLDENQCFLCGACARICPESAIELNRESITLKHRSCTGCGCCEAICLSNAIKLEENYECSTTELAVTEVSCSSCHRLFLAWNEQSGQCPICSRHHYGMREA